MRGGREAEGGRKEREKRHVRSEGREAREEESVPPYGGLLREGKRAREEIFVDLVYMRKVNVLLIGRRSGGGGRWGEGS